MLTNLRIYTSVITLFCLGFFLIPIQSYACSKKSTSTEKKSCSEEKSDKLHDKDSCKHKSDKKCNDGNDCDGNCKHSSCRCSTSSSFVSLLIPIDLNITDPFAENKKQKFGFEQAYYSLGYSSIWQPPKIS
ncbi:hypothetical protein SAMN05444371_0881 [Epilithonimonas mollis]|uniref:Uncharacterized protein n=1 Tax=Epilithonimonas mollis TaxID=216903 RepID=A0A1M6P642_9FLAO|nr:hypothetical protein SAMN05444371_0881 [Epilithonimonas mollis]